MRHRIFLKVCTFPDALKCRTIPRPTPTALHLAAPGVTATTKLCMSVNKKPFNSGEFGHTLVSMASLFLDSFPAHSAEFEAAAEDIRKDLNQPTLPTQEVHDRMRANLGLWEPSEDGLSV